MRGVAAGGGGGGRKAGGVHKFLYITRSTIPHNLVKLEMALEESNKVWLNRRVRVNPERKFFPSKK